MCYAGFLCVFLFCSCRGEDSPICTLEGGIQSLQDLRRRRFAERRATRLSSLREGCGLLSHSKAEFVLRGTRRRYCFELGRPSHLLALGLEGCESRAYIGAVESSDDRVTTNPVAIGDIFGGFCTDLCGAEADFGEPICGQCLDGLELPLISQVDGESLEAPLGLEELRVSLGSLRGGRLPGLDGLPPSYI